MKSILCVVAALLFCAGSVSLVFVSLSFSATKFIEMDEKTLGDWDQKYGSDGYIFCNVNGPLAQIVANAADVEKNDVAKLPDYIDDYKLGGGVQGFVWSMNDGRPKILEMPDGQKIAACWFTGAGDFTVDFPLKRQTSYTMAIYIDDFENGGRKQSLTLNDLKTGDELATTGELSDFGVVSKYAVFQVDRDVQLLVHFVSNVNAVVGGVFFSNGLTAVDSHDKLAITWGSIKFHD